MFTFFNRESRRILNHFLKPISLAFAIACIVVFQTNAAMVEMEWVEPEKYQDIENGVDGKGAFKFKVFKAIEREFEKLAEQLPEDQVLKVKVFDVDLAGQVIEKKSARLKTARLREIKQSQYPKLKFTYKLFKQLASVEEDSDSDKKEESAANEGELLKAGGVNLKAPDFWENRDTLKKEFLRYEKHMLGEWFTFTFLPREPKDSKGE